MTKNTNQLYTALHRLARQMHRFAHYEVHGGHYREQSRLLRLIAENDGIIQRDLAEEMDVRPSSMTEMLIKMEQIGYISRRQDEKDQRIMHIFLTEEGKKAAGESVNDADRFTETMFKSLSEEEIGQMIGLTQKLCDNLDADTNYKTMHEQYGHHHGPGAGYGHRHGRHCQD